MISFRAVKLYAVVVLCAVVLLVFLPSVGNDFVDWDDYAFITWNPHISSISLKSIGWMLTTFSEGIWHPLTWFSHAVDLALWGPNPGPHHLVSVLIHVFNVALFFVVCARLQDAWVELNPSGSSLSEESRFVAALVAALMFGINPLRVESVTWVAERKDVLCAFFFLSSVILYLKYALASDAKTRKRSYLLCVLLAGLALLSKPMAVSLPFVLLLLDYYPLHRMSVVSFPSLIKEKAPFLLLASITVAMNVAAKWGQSVPMWYVPFQTRFMNAFHSIIFYIYKSIAPVALVPMYQMDRNLDYFGPTFIFSALLVVFITGLCVWRAVRNQRLLAAAWSYYLITLGPAMGFIMSYRHAAALRYTYLSTLSLWLLVGLGCARVWTLAGTLKRPFQAKAAVVACVAVLASAYVYQTQEQISVWKNSETLWSYIIDHAEFIPDEAYFGMGRELERKGQWDAALAYYQTALSLNPANNRFRRRIAWVLAQKGEKEQALALVKEVLAVEPRNPSAHVNVGKILALMDRYDEAVEAAKGALQLNPDYQPAISLLMMVHLEKGEVELAREYYRRRISSGYPVPGDIEERLGITNR